MTDDKDQRSAIIGGSGGNTGGTGGPAYSGRLEGAGAGAAGSGGVDEADLQTEERSSSPSARSNDADREGLSAGDDSVEAAIGGKPAVSGTGGSAALSGRRSSEGTGASGTAPDPGDPGGMGGVRAQLRNIDKRPPGGVSPLGDDGSSRD
jgi:hypothetical protein